MHLHSNLNPATTHHAQTKPNDFNYFKMQSVLIIGLTLLTIGYGQVVIKHRPMSDRSVYARRNFAQPDVSSDVYEVYVGPSTVSILR